MLEKTGFTQAIYSQQLRLDFGQAYRFVGRQAREQLDSKEKYITKYSGLHVASHYNSGGSRILQFEMV